MSNPKKRVRSDSSPSKKRIRTKKKKVLDQSNDDLENTDAEELKPELLDAQAIREGMLLLGCVIHVKATFVVMSLPGCLSGIVPLTNISNAFTEAVNNFSVKTDIEEPSPSSIIEVGMLFPCKVIQVSHDTTKWKSHILLSINPQDVNANLKHSCLYPKMVLYGSICSVEDHGYVVDLGIQNVRGFLLNKSENFNKLKVGQVIPTFIQKLTLVSKVCANVSLSELDFNEDFPEVSADNIKLQSILPGAKINADVIEVKHPFVYMKYFDFDVCASLFAFGSTYTGLKTASAVQGTVLYVDPVTHIIYISLNSKPTPDRFEKIFKLKRFEIVKSLKFLYIFKKRAYFKIAGRIYGFISTRDLPSDNSNRTASVDDHNVSKACVLSLHFMDNLVQMTAKPAMTEKKIILPHEVQIGDVYEGVIKEHKDDGMVVNICPGLHGFVRRIFMSDVFVTKPELLFPLGLKIKCRVLATDGNGKVSLTSKGSLLNLQNSYILLSYENVQKDELYKGVIAQKAESHILVLFFNNVKGIVPASLMPTSSVLFVGQTVLCKVVSCDPLFEKLKVSIELDDIPNKNLSNEERSSRRSASKELKKIKNKNVHLAVEDSYSCPLLEMNEKADSLKYDPKKPIKAIIKKVKGLQLDILVNEGRGRVHITEVGCKSEDVYPLKEFSVKQEIQVYIIGEYIKKSGNFLNISHRNWKSFNECALQYPPPVSLSKNFKPGDSVIGFIKEVHDVCATVWLSPCYFGVLDYLHFSDNVKIVRKLHKLLKIGLSLNVCVLNHGIFVQNKMDRKQISLTKLEVIQPEIGKNVLGLVQVTSLLKGLTLKLPFGYHGTVSLTDLSDVYTPVHLLLEKYRQLRFVLCHVLEVDHKMKYCSLSLRKSRLFKKKSASSSFSREVTIETIKPGDCVKGYVKFVLYPTITVEFGRELEGKIQLHKCADECKACSIAKDISTKYRPGSVIDVIIEENSGNKKKFLLTLLELKNKESPKYDRLHITEDIAWDEME